MLSEPIGQERRVVVNKHRDIFEVHRRRQDFKGSPYRGNYRYRIIGLFPETMDGLSHLWHTAVLLWIGNADPFVLGSGKGRTYRRRCLVVTEPGGAAHCLCFNVYIKGHSHALD